MKIEKLDLPESAIEFLKSQGYEKLYPPQADSVKSGLLKGQSVLVSAPTASGKNSNCNACNAWISFKK